MGSSNTNRIRGLQDNVYIQLQPGNNFGKFFVLFIIVVAVVITIIIIKQKLFILSSSEKFCVKKTNIFTPNFSKRSRIKSSCLMMMIMMTTAMTMIKSKNNFNLGYLYMII